MLECGRLWRETVERLSREYPEVGSQLYVRGQRRDAVWILNPAQFDVMITGNLFGDILRRERRDCGQSGGHDAFRQPPAARRAACVEPIHGRPRRISPGDIANPLGTIPSPGAPAAAPLILIRS